MPQIDDKQWHDVVRVVHLAGGLRAENRPGPDVVVFPTTEAKGVCLRLPAYHSLQRLLRERGLSVVGIEYYEHQSQLDGLFPSNWRPFHAGQSDGWPVANAIQRWAELGHAGFENNDFRFMDLSRRISFELQACAFKLLDLSDAYHQELQSLCRRREFSVGSRFATLNSLFIFTRAHSFFSEVGTLRDYLAEFISGFALREVPQTNAVRLMARLRKELLSSGDRAHPLVAEILAITDDSTAEGWMARLSAYRDLVLHHAPIASASHKEFLIAYCLANFEGSCLPAIALQMPDDPFQAKSDRSQAVQFKSIEDWIQSSIEAARSGSGPDVLNFAHESLGRMASLALGVAGHSPISPRRMVLTEVDLRGPPVPVEY